MNIPYQLDRRDHVILGGTLGSTDELVIEAQAARLFVATGLICPQGDERDANRYHIVDGYTWTDIELAVAQFSARPLTQRTAAAAIAEAAAYVFWDRIAAAFPEMTTGDTQIADEDAGAFHQWLTGTSGGFAATPSNTAPQNVPRGRIVTALTEAMVAGGQVLKTLNPALPPAPAAVVSALQACLHHLLRWNFPGARA
ncbi:hypothetical protein [Burkholderia cepacia]|uniref:hypothetical protein n=1 Tax=Burkholderia cepacia TaxID=292 RepID=UPI002AB6332F|nr:hypothetical protein [Burkholderia cepacia]